ncbi:MAG: class I SAM-dependent methyltransferase [Moraxellaceae bacterium]|jgi:16S rRNA (guanine1207-N2)-methyltransferase|nr:class I SAM-dependent methyltransferase [Moraxellaceae bacterium]MBP8851869.1 class I SAM-dependent methyltransferase [Moraxellaceae bacterium]MBP9044801.1 class I SAM-dependent methyltransferase [Moraxellaceae bacterium]MBP9730450.1 class I SAM-dependent methyltransferase [Moraxellaceae bacterium]
MSRGAPDATTVARWREDVVFTESVRGCEFTFHTTWGIFSPRSVDDGSRLLLDHLDISSADNCLDVGCGYGVLGMAMAKLAPQGRTVMVDKDFVAVDYAKANCERNGLSNTEVFLSNGFNQIPKEYKFDLIVSNLPAKVGNEQHYLYLFDAFERLNPGGRFVVVTINGLRDFISRTFKEVFGNYDKLKQGKTYTVAQAIKQ